MEITIDQTELIQAIKNYIRDQGISVRNKELTVELSMTRNPTAYKASVDITGAGVTATPVVKEDEVFLSEKEVAKENPKPPEEKPAPELPQDDGNKMEKDFKLPSKEVEDALEKVDQIVEEAVKVEEAAAVKVETGVPANDVENLFD